LVLLFITNDIQQPYDLVETLDVAMEKTNRKRVAVGKQSKSSFYIRNSKPFVASFYSIINLSNILTCKLMECVAFVFQVMRNGESNGSGGMGVLVASW
jgi:hypothetical protein